MKSECFGWWKVQGMGLKALGAGLKVSGQRSMLIMRRVDFLKGCKTQSQVAEIIANYAEPLEIHVTVKNAGGKIQFGDYRFSSAQFQKLIDYVWCGGYPRWQDEIRPADVSAMRDKIRRNCKGIFEGINIPMENQ